ncbi:hypothetical protein [Ottowia sp. VDI28]|uniref:hypothetical protein n=1 Tax=Ottowia sp. VDI28 TaxID=3133968 RepID=UPI003C3079CD
MKSFSHHLKIAAVLLSAGAALTGCVVAPAPGPVYGGPAYPSDNVYAPVAPPAPYTEVIPVVPFPGAIWVGGTGTGQVAATSGCQAAMNARAPVIGTSRAVGSRLAVGAGSCTGAAGCAEVNRREGVPVRGQDGRSPPRLPPATNP